MSRNCSPLFFEHQGIENFTEPNLPNVIYRYFDTAEDRENFLNGNLWFCGPSQNRFILGNPDPLEYRNANGSFLNEYSLSFSSEILDESRPNIALSNPQECINELIGDLISKGSSLSHSVSWLSKQELERYVSIVSAIAAIRKWPPDGESMLLYLLGIGGRRLRYVEKFTEARPAKRYNGIEVANNARDANIEFQDEREIRFHINTGDFLNGYQGNCLLHLVQYLKINWPSIGKYCTRV